MKRVSILLFAVFCMIGTAIGQNKMTSELRSAARSAQPDERIPVVITLSEQYDANELKINFSNKMEKRAYMKEALQDFAQKSQQSLLNELQAAKSEVSDIQSFWIINGLSCSATPAQLEKIAQRDDVKEISWSKESPTPVMEIRDIETGNRDVLWNIAKIKADQVWNYNGTTGYNGNNVIVAILDCGINYNHPDISNHIWHDDPNYPYGGYNFFGSGSHNIIDDPNNGNGQGTIVAGIIAGDGTQGNATGVAPGAKIMALKTSNKSAQVTEARTIAAMEFALAHGADVVLITAVETGVGPKESYRTAMTTLNNNGLVVITSAGNQGQSTAIPNSIAAPSNCPSPWHNPDETLNGSHTANICVGAVNNNDYKLFRTSIGPVSWNDYPYTANSATQVGHIKPDVMAPGEGITSLSNLGTGYKQGSGSAVAAAHVAATVAMMLEANPDLTPAEIDQFLETSTVKCEGMTTKNNFYGAGRIDALEAMNMTLSTVNAPINLNATASHNQITLTWSGNAGSYELFCNEESLGTVTGNTYTYHTDHSGPHIYYLKANAGAQQSGKSNYATVFVDAKGPMVENLTGNVVGEETTVSLAWDAPVPKTVMRYGNANSTNRNFGEYNGTQPTTTYWAQRFNTRFLLEYAGCDIDTVSLYVNKAGTYQLYLYEGNPNGTVNPALETHTLNVTAADIPGWFDVKLTNTLTVNPTKDLWIVAKTGGVVADPATYCIVTNEPLGFSSLASTDGKNWETQSNNWAWMMKAHLTNATFTYNVQRDGVTLTNGNHLSTLTFQDTNVPAGVHEYTVTTNYGNPETESFPCDPYIAYVQTHFVVTFDAGNGTPAVASLQQEITGGPIILPGATPSAICAGEGFGFAGWTTEPLDITENVPEDLMLEGSEYIPYSDQTLYAVYTNSQNQSSWHLAYSIQDGEKVALVCRDYNVEFNSFNIQNQYGTSQSMANGFNAVHPFTLIEGEGGYYLKDDEGYYLSGAGEGNLIGLLYAGDHTLWNIEIINGYAILRNSEEGVHYQVNAFKSGGQTYFGVGNYTETWNSNRKHVQLYHYVNTSSNYFAYDPGCGSNVMTPEILPMGNATEIHLDPVSVTMSTVTEGATIRYTTDGSEPTTLSDLYVNSQPLEITENTTVKAKAFKSGYTPSATASQVYAFPDEYTSVAAFKAAAADTVIAILNDDKMVVTQQYDKYVYVNGGGNRGLLIFDDYNFLTHSFTEGDSVTAIQGRYTVVNGQPMLTLMHDFSSHGNGGPVEPWVSKINNINNTYSTFDARLVIIKGVTFSQEMTWNSSLDPDTTVKITQSGKTLRVKNRFNALTCSVDTDHTYDVVGLIGREGSTTYLYPRRNSDIRMYHHLTLLPGEHGTLTASDTDYGYLSNVELTVTTENNYHVSALYYYTTNPAQITEIDLATLSFVMPDEDVTVVAEFEVDQTYTVTFDPGTGTCGTTSLTETAWHSGVTLPGATPSNFCIEDGYTFQGWAASFVEETMARPTLYLEGETFYPDGDMTLYAVYAVGGNEWMDITNAADVIEGQYIIATKQGNPTYYLPFDGVTQNPRIVRMNVNTSGEPVSLPQYGNQPLAPANLWTFTKINATQYSISHEDNGVTYYLKAFADANYGISVTDHQPTGGWVVTQDASKGLMLRFPTPEPDRAVRYLSKTNESWANLTIYTYTGTIHLYLSPSNVYSTAPNCMDYVAAPEFQNVPSGIIIEDNYMVEMTCATEGAVIHYTTDGSTPTAESPVYSEPFAITETTTVNAIAFLNDSYSEMSSQLYQFVRRFANIAEFKAAYSVSSSNELAKIMGDVQFVRRFGNSIYVCDASAGLLVRDINNLVTNTYNNGDILQGGIVGTYARENQLQPMMRLSITFPAGVPGTPVQPLEITPAEYSIEEHDARLITLIDAEYNTDYQYNQTQVGFNVTNGINVFDNYRVVNLAGEQGDRYDITGFGGRISYTSRLYPCGTMYFEKYYNIVCDTLVANGTISTTPDHAKANTVVTLNSLPTLGYEVGTWIVTDSDNHPVTVTGNTFVMPAKNVTVSAIIVQSVYTVNATVAPENSGAVTGAEGEYHYGDVVTLTATAFEGNEFYKWELNSGNISNINPYQSTISFTIYSSVDITATFLGATFTVTVAAEPEDGGQVNVSPWNSNLTYNYGTTVHVNAVPVTGYQFDHWVINDTVTEYGPNPYVFNITQDMNFVAHFTVAQHTITLSASPAEGGNITGAGTYTHGDIATLIATANEGYGFIEWQADGATYSVDETLTLTVTEDLNLVALFELLAVDQTIELENGWKWISSYVAYDNNTLSNLENAISASEVNAATIKSQTKYRTYEGGEWYGTMSSMENENMYMVQLDQNLTVTVTGSVVNPEEHPITLNKGWKWIGFLSPTAMSLENALVNLDINVDDVIKGQSGFSTYSGTAWVGSLKNLEPGKGYMYQNMGEDNLTLVYPASAKGSVEEEDIELHWKSDPYRFAHNLSMMVSLDGMSLAEGSHEIGAFVNGECRGSALIQEVEGKTLAFLTVTGEAGDLVSFKVYDTDANEELTGVEEHIVFANNALYGNLRQPYLLHLNANGTNEFNNQVTVFPNPANDKVWVVGSGIQEVRLFNTMGQLVLTVSCGEADQMEIDLGSLSAGVYMMSLQHHDGQVTNKTLVRQ